MTVRALIVDDDPVLTRLLMTRLASDGYAVENAKDGLEALVKLKKGNFDIVVLDVMMPEVNGYDVCYQLRFNDDFAHLPIILVTDREQELNADISARTNIAYCSKPVDVARLTALIQTLVGPSASSE